MSKTAEIEKEEHTQRNKELLEQAIKLIVQMRTTPLMGDFGISTHDKMHLVDRIGCHLKRMEGNG